MCVRVCVGGGGVIVTGTISVSIGVIPTHLILTITTFFIYW